jgi:hypothetical protein
VTGRGVHAAKVQLCAECKIHGVWRFNEATGECIGKHDCATPASSPEAERDAALTATSEANPNAKRAALLIITDTARRLETFSANTVRVEMEIAQVPGPVVGAAFGQAARDGLIRRDGYVPSTQAATHSHPVSQWRSLIFRSQRSAS